MTHRENSGIGIDVECSCLFFSSLLGSCRTQEKKKQKQRKSMKRRRPDHYLFMVVRFGVNNDEHVEGGGFGSCYV